MAFRWRYEDESGGDVAGPDITFDDQQDAEDWLGAQWQELLESGVQQVTLLDGDDEVYGPMGLNPV